MWRFLFLIIIFNSVQAIASTVSCAITINTNNKYNFTLPTISTDKFTSGLSANNSQYRKLYTWDYFMGMSTKKPQNSAAFLLSDPAARHRRSAPRQNVRQSSA
ncbi:hypothetical protein ABIB59_003375 [Citrobacter sp. UYEF32]